MTKIKKIDGSEIIGLSWPVIDGTTEKPKKIIVTDNYYYIIGEKCSIFRRNISSPTWVTVLDPTTVSNLSNSYADGPLFDTSGPIVSKISPDSFDVLITNDDKIFWAITSLPGFYGEILSSLQQVHDPILASPTVYLGYGHYGSYTTQRLDTTVATGHGGLKYLDSDKTIIYLPIQGQYDIFLSKILIYDGTSFIEKEEEINSPIIGGTEYYTDSIKFYYNTYAIHRKWFSRIDFTNFHVLPNNKVLLLNTSWCYIYTPPTNTTDPEWQYNYTITPTVNQIDGTNTHTELEVMNDNTKASLGDHYSTCQLSDGNVLLFSNFDDITNPIITIYDPNTNTFTVKPLVVTFPTNYVSNPSPMCSPYTYELPNNKIFIVGGSGTRRAILYDPSGTAFTWAGGSEDITLSPDPGSHFVTGTVAYQKPNGNILIFIDRSSFGDTDVYVTEYNWASDTFITKSSITAFKIHDSGLGGEDKTGCHELPDGNLFIQLGSKDWCVYNPNLYSTVVRGDFFADNLLSSPNPGPYRNFKLASGKILIWDIANVSFNGSAVTKVPNYLTALIFDPSDYSFTQKIFRYQSDNLLFGAGNIWTHFIFPSKSGTGIDFNVAVLNGNYDTLFSSFDLDKSIRNEDDVKVKYYSGNSISDIYQVNIFSSPTIGQNLRHFNGSTWTITPGGSDIKDYDDIINTTQAAALLTDSENIQQLIITDSSSTDSSVSEIEKVKDSNITIEYNHTAETFQGNSTSRINRTETPGKLHLDPLNGLGSNIAFYTDFGLDKIGKNYYVITNQVYVFFIFDQNYFGYHLTYTEPSFWLPLKNATYTTNGAWVSTLPDVNQPDILLTNNQLTAIGSVSNRIDHGTQSNGFKYISKDISVNTLSSYDPSIVYKFTITATSNGFIYDGESFVFSETPTFIFIDSIKTNSSPLSVGNNNNLPSIDPSFGFSLENIPYTWIGIKNNQYITGSFDNPIISFQSGNDWISSALPNLDYGFITYLYDSVSNAYYIACDSYNFDITNQTNLWNLVILKTTDWLTFTKITEFINVPEDPRNTIHASDTELKFIFIGNGSGYISSSDNGTTWNLSLSNSNPAEFSNGITYQNNLIYYAGYYWTWRAYFNGTNYNHNIYKSTTGKNWIFAHGYLLSSQYSIQGYINGSRLEFYIDPTSSSGLRNRFYSDDGVIWHDAVYDNSGHGLKTNKIGSSYYSDVYLNSPALQITKSTDRAYYTAEDSFGTGAHTATDSVHTLESPVDRYYQHSYKIDDISNKILVNLASDSTWVTTFNEIRMYNIP